MFEDLIKIIPMSLASALSPGIFALALILLGSKKHPKMRILALFVGLAVIGIITIVVGFYFGQTLPDEEQANLTSSLIDLALGIIFVLFGIKILLSKERKIKESKKQIKHENLKLAAAGFVIGATNFDAILLSFAAAKEVGSSENIDDPEKLILLLFILLCLTLPITIPLLVYIIIPNLASRVLSRINKVVLKYSKYIMFGLFIILGIMLIYQGAKYFF